MASGTPLEPQAPMSRTFSRLPSREAHRARLARIRARECCRSSCGGSDGGAGLQGRLNSPLVVLWCVQGDRIDHSPRHSTVQCRAAIQLKIEETRRACLARVRAKERSCPECRMGGMVMQAFVGGTVDRAVGDVPGGRSDHCTGNSRLLLLLDRYP